MIDRDYHQQRRDTQRGIMDIWQTPISNSKAIYAFPTDIRLEIQRTRSQQSSREN